MHGDILISFVVVVLRVGDNVNCMHWVCKMLHKTSWQNFFAITSVIRIGSLIFLSQAVSSCSCYAVLYMSDEHLTLCRTRCKTWPRWKAPGFTLTIFCNQNNPSPDPLALSNECLREPVWTPDVSDHGFRNAGSEIRIGREDVSGAWLQYHRYSKTHWYCSGACQYCHCWY